MKLHLKRKLYCSAAIIGAFTSFKTPVMQTQNTFQIPFPSLFQFFLASLQHIDKKRNSGRDGSSWAEREDLWEMYYY
ncbi:hypothetical protein [Angelakisella massiliensis]|uniref:hypothetical protein n=1 Tax=Angelakisella massiliensis TaxID=1871018 RepID=UPI0024B2560E|nr:hypothetical protein [Angelakisella massiliensis]